MKLIAIERTGLPAEPTAELPEVARDVCASLVSLYATAGFVPPWIGYLADDEGQLVGTCAFKAPPRAGRVELAYFTFPAFEGRGIATRMVEKMLVLAAEHAEPGLLVAAQTLPEESPSTSVLRRHGFMLVGPIEHPDDGLVWEWQRRPAP